MHILKLKSTTSEKNENLADGFSGRREMAEGREVH